MCSRGWKTYSFGYLRTSIDILSFYHIIENMKKFILPLSLLAAVFSASAQELLPYQNPDLSPDDRAADLLGRLTLEQKAQLMQDISEAIPELGIQKYNWWNEALHGAARSGIATVFPQAIGMAASFDPDLLQNVMNVASTEQRIKYIQARKKGNVKRYEGLTVWTPNINIFRDPRWGRGQETYGEDPYLTRKMGYAVVTGLQGQPYQKVYDGVSSLDGSWREYDKLHACLKHYAVHSGPEYERHFFDAKDISQRDLFETYLYAFEALVKTTDVHEVMCAYNAYEGEPCCGSDKLLTQILRNEWGYKGIVTSDCWAIRDFYGGEGHHNIFPGDAALASANAVLSGTDIECGSSYKALPEAVKRGAISEADIDVSVYRLLRDRFRLGEMDDDAIVSWNHIPESELANEESNQLALQMARETMTLLQNKNNVLPLNKPGMKIALVGPNAADSIVMWGNYSGTPRHTFTVLEALQSSLKPGQSMTYHKGSNIVTPELFESVLSECVGPNGKKGFQVQYWNNPKRAGRPDAEVQLSSPWQLSTCGATVFAPGVNLTGFSGQYRAKYHATRSLELMLEGYCAGEGEFLVNNDTIAKFRTNGGIRPAKGSLRVEAGKDYDIVLNFAHRQGEAQFSFNLGVMTPVDLDKLVDDTREADVYVYVGGISPLLEGEEMKVPYEGFRGGDRTSIQLPAIQRETLRRLHATGKPVVFVNMSGSAIGLTPELQTCDAILQAWYGGQQGGQAVADVLLGDYNPSGRLPITFYDSVKDLPDFRDYNITNQTYRYYKGKPVFAFGQGMSYSTFEYGQARARKITRTSGAEGSVTNNTNWDHYDVDTNEEVETIVNVRVPVTNTSKVDGVEVVQVYLRRLDDVDGPQRSLRGFARVAIPAGQTVEVTVPVEDLRTFNPETCRMELVHGAHSIYVGCSSRAEDLQEMIINL